MNLEHMRSAIREFFIRNYNGVTQAGDDVVAIARSERYEKLLSHYMKLGEKNSCKCFNTVEEILGAMTTNRERDLSYIKNGV